MPTHKHTPPSFSLETERCWWKEIYWRDRRKNMEGVREEEKVMEIPCTGSLVFLSLPVFFLNYFILYWFSSTVQLSETQNEAWPQYRGIGLSISNQRSQMADLTLISCSHWGHLWDLMWGLSCWTTRLWGESWGRLFISLKRAQKRHFSLLHPV